MYEQACQRTSKGMNEKKKYDRPNKVNKRASDRTRVANVTNEHAHARTHAHVDKRYRQHIEEEANNDSILHTSECICKLGPSVFIFFYACALLFMFTFLKTRHYHQTKCFMSHLGYQVENDGA